MGGVLGVGFGVHGLGVLGDFFESDAANGAYSGAEIGLQQRLGQADALEYLGTSIGADGGDAHLCHYLEKAFLHSLDIVGFGCGVVFLYLVTFHKVVEDGKGHVGTECRGSIAQQQGSVHRLSDFARFYYQGGLDSFAYADEVVVDG